MRNYVFMAATLAAACAHGDARSRATGDGHGPSADISVHEARLVQGERDIHEEHPPSIVTEQDHPPTELRGDDKPAPGSAGRATRLPATRGDLDMAKPAPEPAAEATPIALEPARIEASPVAVPAKPAGATEVDNPLKEEKAAPKLGSRIAQSDAELRERIQGRLLERGDLSYTARHVSVEVENRNVTLRGQVRNAHERAEVEALIRQIKGVRRFHSDLALINPPTEPAVR